MKKIAIIGSGWLGSEVALKLKSNVTNVLSTYRKNIPEKLNNTEVELFKWDLINPELKSNLELSDILIVIIPPKEGSNESILTIQQLVSLKLNAERIIFISSTGIYPKAEGVFNESTEINPTVSNLSKMEYLLRNEFMNRLNIIRLGGLFDENRHPLKFISGKEMNSNGKDSLSLIHKSDVVRYIENQINSEEVHPSIVNLIYPLKISKKEYYDELSKKWEVNPPVWNCNNKNVRIINSILNTDNQCFSLLYNPINATFES